ncbi:MAG TPA: hypothetical protein VH722_20775 [Alphaproteobacteria bacterium]|jgi:hypothetical protein|nr:hypothetical protein [Alphaproteobacteria bacterium]
MRQFSTAATWPLLAAMLLTGPAFAQEMNMPGMDDMPGMEAKKTDTPPKPEQPAMTDMPGMEMPGMSMTMPMTGVFGPYAMSREASGTSWQPESTPDGGLHFMAGPWMLMAHGYLDAIYDNQGGPRGNDKTFSASMGMLMAQRPLGDDGTLGLRTMLSLDPLMGANGYPLLFATGETANGREPLIDRQHPHDLFMELSASYSLKLNADSAVFAYAGLPGEPALGPAAFMHRQSGMDIPEAPITHHWLDSTHITYGVLTGGYVQGPWKIEGSVFRGREPDERRYDIEGPKLDSVSARLTWNPAPNWSFQTSWGYLKSPEELAPNVDENRLTASGTYNLPFGDNVWATTFAWGRKMNHPGHTLDGFLLESELILHDTHTIFARAERVAEDELFEEGPLLDRVETVEKISLGYIRDFHPAENLKFGIGGLVSRYDYPSALDRAYGDPISYMIFLRLKLE